ncbi:MAG: alpha/beta hydrolase [Burkholderiales bacterium]|nr:alpha/beta hydrolase [Burkholderiales bacterium]MDE2565185.1 alpha/beta hydrolase [Burkholderiales bacterium]
MPPAPSALPALPPALDAERCTFDGLSCYVAGSGPPLLLVHSVNAAASAAEVRPLFEHARTHRQVYALDLPGYGHSDRRARAYTPRLMTDALHAAAAQIRRRCGPGPVDALAVSLSCEFLARAAAERPAEWRRLALVSPTGFNGTRPRRGPPGGTLAKPRLLALLNVPLWSDALFRGLTRPGVVRYFLKRTWGGPAIDEAMWAYAVATARQPGARHAPLAFLSGALFSTDIHAVYESLAPPVWVSHGVRGDFADYRGLAPFEARPNWRVSVFDTGALPYFEQPAAFCSQLDAWMPP